MQNIVGIDIGGSHITLAQVDPDKHEIITSTYVRERVDSFAILKQFSMRVSGIEKAIGDLRKEELLIGIAMRTFRLRKWCHIDVARKVSFHI